MAFCGSERIFGQQKISFVNASAKPTNSLEIAVKEDSAKDKEESISFEYIGNNKDKCKITVSLDKGILNSKIIEFQPFDVELTNSAVIAVPFKIIKGFKYNDIVGKAIFFNIKSDKADILKGGDSTIQVSFIKKVEAKKAEPKIMDDFFRLNLGTNFDYLSSSPLKLLYADASVMTPTAFVINKKDKEVKFGFYGRIYQFQGVSAISSRETDRNILADTATYLTPNVNGAYAGRDSILKSLTGNRLLVQRPYYTRQADLIEKRTYGMAVGITTPIVYDESRNFYMSLGIHFEGMMTHFERKNTYTTIFKDTLTISETAFLSRSQQTPEAVSRRVNFTGMIGLSIPIIWKFSDFELKILPAFSFKTFDDSELYTPNNDKRYSYSVHAVLTEIKETGLNIGAEIRGYSSTTPTTFSIFVAKTFNMKKFGDFLKL